MAGKPVVVQLRGCSVTASSFQTEKSTAGHSCRDFMANKSPAGVNAVSITCAANSVSPPSHAGACRAAYPGAVTDLDETITLPDLIATYYLTSIDEVTEHLRAANQLGLGVRVRSYLEPEEESDSLTERWEVELLTGSPVQEDEPAEQPGEADPLA